MRPPPTRYARVDDDRIAYQVLGEGPLDLVLTMGGAGHVDMKWEDPVYEDFHRRIATLGRLIMFDGRGSGASDPLPPGSRFAWESWVEDLRAVMDEVGSNQAVIIGALDAVPSAIMFAATQPDRTTGLVLFNGSARITQADDYPAGLPPEAAAALKEMVKKVWGSEELAAIGYPERADDAHFLSWLARFNRASASPRVFGDHADQFFAMDVREALPLVQVPTLVLCRPESLVPREQTEYLADHISGAKLVTLPGRGMGVMGQHVDATVAALAEFLTGAPTEMDVDRVLATVLFTDIVDSTVRAAAVGDKQWREILDRHDHAARAEVQRHRGRFVKSTGDGMLATFDAPTRALRCAFGLAEALSGAGVEIRAGLHTGEIELRGDDVGGIGVHIAARTAAEAGARQVLVTRTVRELATGADLTFAPRGLVELRGIPGEWDLFEAEIR